MKPPYSLPGQTGFFNDRNEWQCTGSMMGRRESLPSDATLPLALHVRRVPMSKCGCYDQGGAYWGSGPLPLFCAWGGNEEETVSLFLRAPSIASVRATLREKFPSVSFLP